MQEANHVPRDEHQKSHQKAHVWGVKQDPRLVASPTTPFPVRLGWEAMAFAVVAGGAMVATSAMRVFIVIVTLRGRVLCIVCFWTTLQHEHEY